MDELHGHVEQAVVLAGVINSDNVGMVENPGGARLMTKAAKQFIAFQTLHVQPHGLQGDG